MTQAESMRIINWGRATVDSSKLFTMLDHAQQHLKAPGIRISCDGTQLKLKRSRISPDYIYVNNRDSGITYAEIRRDGSIKFRTIAYITPNLPKLIALLCRAPEVVVSEFGRLTGHCCFCWLLLTDERSTAKGYGPICAAHYNLPWGE